MSSGACELKVLVNSFPRFLAPLDATLGWTTEHEGLLNQGTVISVRGSIVDMDIRIDRNLPSIHTILHADGGASWWRYWPSVMLIMCVPLH
jgi:hypothetical protein